MVKKSTKAAENVYATLVMMSIGALKMTLAGPDSLSLRIDWYHFQPTLVAIRQYLLASKCTESTLWPEKKILTKKNQYGYKKTQNLTLISLKKLKKISHKKSY